MKAPPLAKIGGLAIFSLAVLLAASPIALLALALALVLAAVLLEATVARLGRMLWPALPFIGLVAAFQWLLSGPEVATVSTARMLLLYVGGSIVTATTGEAEFTGAVRQILGPVARVTGTTIDRDLATMMALTIAFIPIIAEEHAAIRLAQEARGVSFSGLYGALKGEIVTLIPLVYALEFRADRIALAMEARCYGAMRRK